MEGLLGLPEGSRAQRCPGSNPIPVSRVTATHTNPAWHPKPWSLSGPRSLPPCTRVSRGPPHSTLDLDRGYYGEAMVGLWWYERTVGDAVPPIPRKTARNPRMTRKCCNRSRLPDRKVSAIPCRLSCRRYNFLPLLAGHTSSGRLFWLGDFSQRAHGGRVCRTAPARGE